MAEIPWNEKARLTRVAGPDEEMVGEGVLQQLVASFLELSPEQQNGVVLRASGPDWSREWDADEIRELAARPEATGIFGRWDGARDDPDDRAGEREQAFDEQTLVEAGVSGPTGSGHGPVGDLPENQDERHGGDGLSGR